VAFPELLSETQIGPPGAAASPQALVRLWSNSLAPKDALLETRFVCVNAFPLAVAGADGMTATVNAATPIAAALADTARVTGPLARRRGRSMLFSRCALAAIAPLPCGLSDRAAAREAEACPQTTWGYGMDALADWSAVGSRDR
jgi:hypothetical protein